MNDSNIDPAPGSSAQTVRTLMDYMGDSDLEELELQWANGRIRIVQDAHQSQQLTIAAEAVSARAGSGTPVVAPLTGVYYSRPSPEQPIFVEVGSPVSVGDVVGLIETMKLFNEIVAEVEGRVEMVSVRDGDLVEKGQVLMRISAAD